MATMASMHWRGRRWSYIAVLHGRLPPSQQEWDAYCERLASTKEPALLRGIVVSLRGAPNARQRAQVVAVHQRLRNHEGMGCVLSDSAVSRGIVNALSWAGVIQGTHAFSLREMEPALEYVGVEEGEKQALIDALVRLGDTIDDENPVRVALDRARRAS
jgi:hypothetical protein